MNKPLLKWKREIEEKINIVKSEYKKTEYAFENYFTYKKAIDCLEKQLQMIDDIIEMIKYQFESQKFEGAINIEYAGDMVERIIGE